MLQFPYRIDPDEWYSYWEELSWYVVCSPEDYPCQVTATVMVPHEWMTLERRQRFEQLMEQMTPIAFYMYCSTVTFRFLYCYSQLIREGYYEIHNIRARVPVYY